MTVIIYRIYRNFCVTYTFCEADDKSAVSRQFFKLMKHELNQATCPLKKRTEPKNLKSK